MNRNQKKSTREKKALNGVMFNAYPDSIGATLSDCIAVLKKEEFSDVFSLFYVLPTFFNSDLDRGFSIIDYNLNQELVKDDDIQALHELGIQLKFDIVLNHLSVASPQFKDILTHGDASLYKDFFINWNTFWAGNGEQNEDGIIIPKKEFLDKLFMRKSGLPILNVQFPDGSKRPYWNTFYQKITFKSPSVQDIIDLLHISDEQAKPIADFIEKSLQQDLHPNDLKWEEYESYKDDLIQWLNAHQTYLGQMDVNAKSPLVWEFYDDVLSKVKSYGCQILRLDAFAYLHKTIGESNFFNVPGTWDYLSRIHKMAVEKDLILLPEIHAEYGQHLHDEVADKGYVIYDFFLPGLLIHAIEKNTSRILLKWAKEIVSKGYKTVNMLGCHDGIPLLDLKGKEIKSEYREGLLPDEEIEEMMDLILKRGGRVKNLYGADGKKISYYQINATYYSALGESDQKMLLARAIQLFMPGVPQIWYLDLFAGVNDHEAADKAGAGGHKEINRTTLSLHEIEQKIHTPVVKKQLDMLRLRNTSKAFLGHVYFDETPDDQLSIRWEHDDAFAHLAVNFTTQTFTIDSSENNNDLSS